ncbi:hypothetical protein [Kocuria marina]|uniref:hypothetical protein n=1 Tax=Kocuria marina TaxID=223184 RepID=UPI0022E1A52C|nr:hypothetical protein [Kocuria marina]
MSTPRPSPAVMRGRKDPALGVRPVDYTSWRPSERQGDADAVGDVSEPRAGAAADGAPKPGPGPRTVATGGPTAPIASNAPRELTVDPQLAEFVRLLRAGITPDTAAPEGAFYTVDSDQPGAPALEVPADGVVVQGVWDVSENALHAVVADPEDTWTADLGRTDYYVRGRLCVQVTRAEHRVVGIYRSGWAVARRPDETWADTPDSLEHTGAKPGGSGTRYPTNRRELLERLRGAGFEVTTSGPTHGKITHPDVPGRFLPFSSTPSSQRYGRHVTTAVKRVFGIDLRDPAKTR